MICGAMRRALGRVQKIDLNDPDFFCFDCKIDSARFLRDPDGETSHGILVINSHLLQRWTATI